jgi:primosomal protein N'
MPDGDITQISLGRFKVGLYGLKSAIQEVQALGNLSDDEIAQALLTRLKPKNYIPAANEDEYRQACLREFKKARGEEVEEEESGLSLLEKLRRRYEELMRKCEKCTDPSMCPRCNIAMRLVEICELLDSKSVRGSGGGTDERS